MNQLQKINNEQMIFWEDKEKQEEMKSLICKTKLTDLEFATFIQIGRAAQLNPFLREMWVVKYDANSPASIFIGRDGYRKAAQRHSDYEYHVSDAVYSNDTFKFNLKDGYPEHEYSLKDRGQLIGAYCIVKRKSSERPSYVFVRSSEYSTGKSLWASKPETMIKKVSESQALRSAFQDLLGGTYSPEEVEKDNFKSASNEDKCDLLEKIKKAKLVEKENIEYVDEGSLKEYATPEQIKNIQNMLYETMLSEGRIHKALDHYCVSKIDELSEKDAEDFLCKLNKIKETETTTMEN